MAKGIPIGAPDGIRHGKAVHSFDVVEWARDLYEIEGLKPRKIFELVPCVSLWTLNDWLYYRTRTRA